MEQFIFYFTSHDVIFVLENDKLTDRFKYLAVDEPKDAAAVEREFPLVQLLKILPRNEVADRIFGVLDPISKASCRLVCKDWNSMVEQTLVLSPILTDESFEEINDVVKRGVQLGALTICLREFNYPTEGLGWTKVLGIQFLPRHSKGIPNSLLNSVLSEFSNIRYLFLHSAAFKEVVDAKALRENPFPKLETLKLSASNSDGEVGFNAATEILKNMFPSLKTVFLTLISMASVSTSLKPLKYAEIYEFMSNHYKTLRNIRISHCNELDGPDATVSFLNEDLEMEQSQYQSLQTRLKDVQLTHFEVEISRYEGRKQFIFCKRLLAAQNGLKTLIIKDISQNSYSLWVPILQLLQRCSGTIENVLLDGCLCLGEEFISRLRPTFCCTYIKDCKKLQMLRLPLCGFTVFNIFDLPKQIKSLNLGNRLNRRTINYIISNMHDLDNWTLQQLSSRRESHIPRVNVRIFKDIMTMSRLKTLTLSKATSAWQRIRRLVQKTRGLRIMDLSESEDTWGDWETCSTDRGKLLTIGIDRDVFHVIYGE